MQVELETLRTIGQLINLPHTRYEVRTLLHALTLSTPLLNAWEDCLRRYQLPTIHQLISNPIPYSKWKSMTRQTIDATLQVKLESALETKPSLSFFHHNINAAQDLYPSASSSKFLRQSIIIRSQLATQTYLTQSRLCKIKGSTTKTCQLCKEDDEDTLHFIASCPALVNQRQTFLTTIHKLDIPQEALDSFQPSDPQAFTKAVLLPCTTKAFTYQKESIISTSLSYLYSIHTHRANALLNIG